MVKWLMLVLAGVGAVAGGTTWLWWRAEAARDELGRQQEHTEAARQAAEEARQGEAELRRELAHVSALHQVGLAHREWEGAQVGRALDLLSNCPADRRGWEWHYVHRLCHAHLHRFTGHTNFVWGVAWAPDGRRVASASGDGTVRLWDLNRGTGMILRGHSGPVWCVAFSSDGATLVSGGRDRTVRGWDPTTGHQRFVLVEHRGNVNALAFGRDGSRLAAGTGAFGLDATGNQNGPGEVKVWDLATRTVIRTFREFIQPVWSVALSPDGGQVAGLGFDGTLQVWDIKTGGRRLGGRRHSKPGTGVAYHPDGKRLITTGEDGFIRLWDLSKRQLLAEQKVAAQVKCVAFNPDGKSVATGATDQVVRLWDTSTLREIGAWRGHTGRVSGLAFSPDGGRIVTGGADRTVLVWDARAEQRFAWLGTHTGWVVGIQFRPDGKQLASAGRDGFVRLWDVKTRRLERELRTDPTGACSLAYFPDGRRLVSGGFSGDLTVWDIRKGTVERRVKKHTRPICGLALCPRGRLLASVGYDNLLTLWDTTSWRELWAVPGISGGVAFSADSRHVYAGGQDFLRALDATTGQKRMDLPGHRNHVGGVAISPNGRTLCSVSYRDRACRLWDTETGRCLRVLQGLQAESAAFTPDGQRLIVGSDELLKTIDVVRGQEVLHLAGAAGMSGAVAVSPDGKQIASGGWDGAVRLRDATPLADSPKELNTP